MARIALRNLGLLQPLVSTLKRALEWKLPAVAKNAAWALATIIRGDVTSVASTFCSPSLLTSDLLSYGLLAAEQQHQQQSADDISTWSEVVDEFASIVAECTNRDDETIIFLMASSNQLADALAHRLVASAQVLSAQPFSDPSRHLEPEDLWRQIRITMSCLNAVGNVVNSCNGVYVPRIVLAADQSLAIAVSRLIEIGSSSNNRELQSVGCGASWVAGAMLCDAGIQDHPSTTVAAPLFLPVFCKVFPNATLELQREVASALSNALHDPPLPAVVTESIISTCEVNNAQQLDHPAIVDMSTLIARETETMLQLVRLLKRTDHAAALAAVQIVGTLLRVVPSFPSYLSEIGGVQILEECFELWGNETSSSDRDLSAGDMAAELLDTYYSDDTTDYAEMDEVSTDVLTRSAEGTLAWGDRIPSTGSTPSAVAPSPSSGRGRGRGKPIPAWMRSSA